MKNKRATYNAKDRTLTGHLVLETCIIHDIHNTLECFDERSVWDLPDISLTASPQVKSGKEMLGPPLILALRRKVNILVG